MSYSRDPDASTRGAGAIAAIDGKKSRRRRLLERQRFGELVRRDRMGVHITRNGLSGDPVQQQDGGGLPGTGGGRRPGGLLSQVLVPRTAPSASSTPARSNIKPSVSIPPRASVPVVGRFVPRPLVPRTTTPVSRGRLVLPSPVVPLTPVLPAVETDLPHAPAGGGGGGGGGSAATPTTTAPYYPGGEELSPPEDEGGEEMAPTATAAPSKGKTLLFAGLGIAALWLLFGGKD